MALRLGDFILFAEIDNRIRGRVRGTLIINGCQHIITLDLEGNCHNDLAGCTYVFYNASSQKWKGALPQQLQQGSTGDISASRKVKIPDLPLAEFKKNPTASPPKKFSASARVFLGGGDPLFFFLFWFSGS